MTISSKPTSIPEISQINEGSEINKWALDLEMEYILNSIRYTILPRSWVRRVTIDELFDIYYSEDNNASFWEILRNEKPELIDVINEEFNKKNNFEEVDVKLWHFLVFYWFITSDQLVKALELQENENNKIKLSHLLLKNKIVSKETIAGAWKVLWYVKLWEYLFLQWHLDVKSINSAIEETKKTWNNLWEQLIINNLITEATLFQILEDLKIIKLWEYLLKNDMVSRANLMLAFEKQQETWEKLWKILLDRWFITETELFEFISNNGWNFLIEELSLVEDEPNFRFY